MFKIEKLLNLFQDDVEVTKIISTAYIESQRENKELSDSVFQHLFFLKSIQPNICIKVNYKKQDSSNYNPMTNTINLNGFFNESTFLHELTHLFSYYYSKFDIPQDYYDFKNEFLSSNEFCSLIISFLDLCKQEKQKLLETTLDLDNNFTIDKNSRNMRATNKCDEKSYFIICRIEDIIDSIFGGKSHTSGLTYFIDNESIPKKSYKSAGHGCDYFKKNEYEFEEIIADYQAIKLLDPDNQLFVLLKLILGDNFVSFLDERCRLINGEKIMKSDFDFNNITSKK